MYLIEGEILRAVKSEMTACCGGRWERQNDDECRAKWLLWRMFGEIIINLDVSSRARGWLSPSEHRFERETRDPLHAIRSHQSDQSIGELGWGKPPSPILALLLLYKGGQHKTRARRRPRMKRGGVGEWGGSWLPNSSDLLIWFCICIWQQTKAIVG